LIGTFGEEWVEDIKLNMYLEKRAKNLEILIYKVEEELKKGS